MKLTLDIFKVGRAIVKPLFYPARKGTWGGNFYRSGLVELFPPEKWTKGSERGELFRVINHESIHKTITKRESWNASDLFDNLCRKKKILELEKAVGKDCLWLLQ